VDKLIDTEYPAGIEGLFGVYPFQRHSLISYYPPIDRLWPFIDWLLFWAAIWWHNYRDNRLFSARY